MIFPVFSSVGCLFSSISCLVPSTVFCDANILPTGSAHSREIMQRRTQSHGWDVSYVLGSSELTYNLTEKQLSMQFEKSTGRDYTLEMYTTDGQSCLGEQISTSFINVTHSETSGANDTDTDRIDVELDMTSITNFQQVGGGLDLFQVVNTYTNTDVDAYINICLRVHLLQEGVGSISFTELITQGSIFLNLGSFILNSPLEVSGFPPAREPVEVVVDVEFQVICLGFKYFTPEAEGDVEMSVEVCKVVKDADVQISSDLIQVTIGTCGALCHTFTLDVNVPACILDTDIYYPATASNGAELRFVVNVYFTRVTIDRRLRYPMISHRRAAARLASIRTDVVIPLDTYENGTMAGVGDVESEDDIIPFRNEPTESKTTASVNYPISACQCNSVGKCDNTVLTSRNNLMQICLTLQSDDVVFKYIQSLDLYRNDTLITSPVTQREKDPITKVEYDGTSMMISTYLTTAFFRGTNADSLTVTATGFVTLMFATTGRRRLSTVRFDRELNAVHGDNFNVDVQIEFNEKTETSTDVDESKEASETSETEPLNAAAVFIVLEGFLSVILIGFFIWKKPLIHNPSKVRLSN